MAIWLAKGLVVHEDAALANGHGVSGHADQALDEIFIAVGKRRVENHHLLAARFAPESHMITREGQADIIAEAAHEQMIANEQSALHRGGGNHAGLHHGAGNQEKCQGHPNPGEQLANEALAEGPGLNSGRMARAVRDDWIAASGRSGARSGNPGVGARVIIIHGVFLRLQGP